MPTPSFAKFVCTTAVLFGFAYGISTAAPRYEIVHAFELGPQRPVGALHVSEDGVIYGVGSYGGKNSGGSIFRTEPSGETKILHHFPVPMTTGTINSAGFVKGPEGALYATVASFPGAGSVFKVSKDDVCTKIVKFTGPLNAYPGSSPNGLPAFDSNGNLYGTTTNFGIANSNGSLFKLTPSGGYDVLANFQGSSGTIPGSSPGSVIVHSNGKIYGVTESGGTAGLGTLYSCTVDGQFVSLLSFTGRNGTFPGASPNSLIEGPDGTIYGTTSRGGIADLGTVFSITPTGEFKKLVQFTGASSPGVQGAFPIGQLVFRSDGFLYGVTTRTLQGFVGSGTVYKMSPSGEITTVAQFNGGQGTPSGEGPTGLVDGPDGELYGATTGGGAGTLFKVTQGNELRTLLSFTAGLLKSGGVAPGVIPNTAVTEGPDGALYGTTGRSGVADGGTIFRLSKSGGLTQLIDFTGAVGPNLGFNPAAPLTITSDGTIYGTTQGGVINKKTVFRVRPDGTFTTLVDFESFSGNSPTGYPTGPLVVDASGSVYGVTSDFSDGPGTVYKVTSDGEFTTLHSFSSDGPNHPGTGLTVGPDGSYYGGTSGDYITGRGGSLFKITPAGEFLSLATFPDGTPQSTPNGPSGPLYIDNQGQIYGTTQAGGVHNLGTAFKWSAAGGLSTLSSFGPYGGTTAILPASGLTRAQDGMLYGACRGTVFRQPENGPPETVLAFPPPTTQAPQESLGVLCAASDGNLYGGTLYGGPFGGGVVFRLRFGRAADTMVAASITPVTGTLRATVGAGTEDAQLTFEYGESASLGSETTPTAVPRSGTPTEAGVEIAGLRSKTRYFFRAKTVTATGTQRGEIRFFDTLSLPPTVALNSPAQGAEFTLPGILNLAASAVDEDGFVARVEFFLDGVKCGEDSEAPFAFDLTNPPPGLHAISAVAYDDDGRSSPSFSREVRVLIPFPTVVSLPATNATLASAILHGKASSFAAVANVYFEWGIDQGFQFRTPDQTIEGDGNVRIYEAPIGGLLRGTTYRFRAVAENVSGTTAGDEMTFTTLPNHPPVAMLDEALLPAAGARIGVAVRANDSDEDGDALTIVAVSQPKNGTAEIADGSIVYQASALFPGYDSFTYQLSDGYATAAGTVNIIGFQQLKGRYAAVPADAEGPHGVVEVNVSAVGAFTGTLGFKGNRWTLGGAFDENGKATLVLTKPSALIVRMTMESGGAIGGKVEEDGGVISGFTAPRSTGTGSYSDPRRFTTRLVRNEERGWAAIAAKRSGKFSINGKLEDATPFFAAGTIRDDHIACMHTKLYGAAGSYLAGEFKLAESGMGATMLGSQRPADIPQGAAASYRTFTAETYRYSPALNDTFPFPLGIGRNLLVRFAGVNPATNSEIHATVDQSGRVTFAERTTRSSLIVRRETGEFTGKTLLPKSSRLTSFGGVFLQGIGRGEGVLGRGLSSGSVNIEAVAE